uniref:DUF7887 domain-containing protein n=2 Tax=Rhizophora mucronata TaxID=61149 RepID=A0A2P2JBY8_RHIMU
MGVIERSSLFSNLACHLHVKRNGQKGLTARAKKPGDLPENSKAQQLHIFTLRVPTPVFARSAVAMFGLGFVDAGYSGDWSRIGAISKEMEDFLKVAAFVVVPFCVFLVLSISRTEKEA